MPTLDDLKRDYYGSQLGLTQQVAYGMSLQDLELAFFTNPPAGGGGGGGVSSVQGRTGAVDLSDLYNFGETNLVASNMWSGVPHTNRNTSTLSLNRLILTPLWIPSAKIFDRIACEVTTAGAAGSLVRLGLFTINAALTTATLLVDAGTIDGTLVQRSDITINQSFGPGNLWLGACAQVVSPTLRCASGTMAAYSLPSVSPEGGSVWTSLSANGVTGAFAMSYTVAPQTGVIPIVWVRAV